MVNICAVTKSLTFMPFLPSMDYLRQTWLYNWLQTDMKSSSVLLYLLTSSRRYSIYSAYVDYMCRRDTTTWCSILMLFPANHNKRSTGLVDTRNPERTWRHETATFYLYDKHFVMFAERKKHERTSLCVLWEGNLHFCTCTIYKYNICDPY